MGDLNDRINAGASLQPSMSQLLTVHDVAGILQVSERSVRRWITCSTLPVQRIGRCVRVTPEALDRFIQGEQGKK